MKAYRSAIYLAGAISLALVPHVGLQAQVSDEIILNIMRECAKIDDPTARLACYDNNIRAGGFDGRGPVVPGQSGNVSGSSGPVAPGNTSQGFGSEDIKRPERFETPSNAVESISARVSKVRELQPGIYEVTLESGAVWAFSDSVPRTFRVPTRDSTVEINRASLGSFLMVVDGQRSVRVRRVK